MVLDHDTLHLIEGDLVWHVPESGEHPLETEHNGEGGLPDDRSESLRLLALDRSRRASWYHKVSTAGLEPDRFRNV